MGPSCGVQSGDRLTGRYAIGEITLYDHDTVELSNLHRQVLHNESRIGMPKATSAALSLML